MSSSQVGPAGYIPGSGQPGTASPSRRRSTRLAAFIFLFSLVAVMWIVEGVDQALQYSVGGKGFDDDGVRPWSTDGLLGILLQPLLHGSWPHLIGNSIAMLVLGSIISLSGLSPLLKVTVVSWLLSGVVAWLIGGLGTMHIGASGIVFGYIFYVIVRGIFSRKFWHLLVGVVIAAYYGLGALSGLSPLQVGVSWQSHLGGAVAGVLSAAGLRKRQDTAPSVNAGPVRWSTGSSK